MLYRQEDRKLIKKIGRHQSSTFYVLVRDTNIEYNSILTANLGDGGRARG